VRHTHTNTRLAVLQRFTWSVECEPALATIEDVRTAESEEEVEEPVSNAIDNDTLEDREEMEVDEDSAAEDANYDFGNQDARCE